MVCQSVITLIIEGHLPQVHGYADDTQLYLSFSPSKSSNMESAIEAMTNCIEDVRHWMISDRLMINDDKTEFMIIGTRQQLAKVEINNISVGDYSIKPVPIVRDLAAWLDSRLSMATHVTKTCSSAFYQLHNIRRVRKYLSRESAETLIVMASYTAYLGAS